MPQGKKRNAPEVLVATKPTAKNPDGLAEFVTSRERLEKQITGRIRTDEELLNSLTTLQTFRLRQYLTRYWEMDTPHREIEKNTIAWELVKIDLKAAAYAERGLHQFMPKVRREADYWDVIARTVLQHE